MDTLMDQVAVIEQTEGESWVLFNGDSCQVLPTIPDKSVDLSIFSPPFMSLYVYSDTPRDIGNCGTLEEFLVHFRFIVQELHRVMRPGRNVCVHIQDVVSTQASDGIRGIKDFTGPVAELFQDVGFAYCGKIPIDKNPQMQAARNKVHELMFATKQRDACSLVPVMIEYVMIFKAPGKNMVPVVNPIDNETWIDWAHGIWPDDGRSRNRKALNPDTPYTDEWEPRILPFYDIRETDVLNSAVARDSQDERHMCPLQLGLIERLVRLYTNPGEVVLDPFNGIGSSGYEAVRLDRRYIGIELKPIYYRVAARNLRNAESSNLKLDLFNPELEAIPA